MTYTPEIEGQWEPTTGEQLTANETSSVAIPTWPYIYAEYEITAVITAFPGDLRVYYTPLGRSEIYFWRIGDVDVVTNYVLPTLSLRQGDTMRIVCTAGTAAFSYRRRLTLQT